MHLHRELARAVHVVHLDHGAAAALGAEGLAADVTMLVGNGYVPGHAAYAMELLRSTDGVRKLFEGRLEAHA